MTPKDPASVAYQKGYQAGLRRKQRERKAANAAVRERAFWERAFLAALPECVDSEGWKRGEKPIIGREERTQLAAGFADDALTEYRSRFQ